MKKPTATLTAFALLLSMTALSAGSSVRQNRCAVLPACRQCVDETLTRAVESVGNSELTEFHKTS